MGTTSLDVAPWQHTYLQFLIPNLDQYFEDGRNICSTADPLTATRGKTTRDMTAETRTVTMTTRSSTRHDATRPGDSTLEGDARPDVITNSCGVLTPPAARIKYFVD